MREILRTTGIILVLWKIFNSTVSIEMNGKEYSHPRSFCPLLQCVRSAKRKSTINQLSDIATLFIFLMSLVSKVFNFFSGSKLKMPITRISTKVHFMSKLATTSHRWWMLFTVKIKLFFLIVIKQLLTRKYDSGLIDLPHPLQFISKIFTESIWSSWTSSVL